MLIAPEALIKRIHDKNVVVFDCRFQLANPNHGRELYLKSHIETAYYLDLDQDLASPVQKHGGRHPLPDLDAFAEKLSAAGVTASTEVVLYDAGEGMAARAWWLIRYCGHSRVSLLDGGFTSWIAKHLPVTDEVPLPRAGSFIVQTQPDMVASLADIEEFVAGKLDAVLLDARAPERFRGEVEPIDPVGGHIPGAMNAPWQDGVTPDGTWRSPEEQRRRFQGLEQEKTWITYCGSGVTACSNVFALALAGKHAKLYPGSWSDWVSYPEHPVEKGTGKHSRGNFENSSV